jgi:hypothetical protein
MEVISGAGVGREMESHFIGVHGPYTGVPDSVPLGDSGIPEACADDAPLEGACQTCQTQANPDAGQGKLQDREAGKGRGAGS